MRYRRLLISDLLLLEMFTAGEHKGWRVVNDAVPEDAEIVSVRRGSPPNVIEILLSSPKFAEVRADHIPVLTPKTEGI